MVLEGSDSAAIERVLWSSHSTTNGKIMNNS